MGMYAGYYRISDVELEQLRQLEERALLEQVEELTEDETAEACDLDKMWDALHFVLTGDTLSDAADHDPLSEAVCGSVFLARQIHVGGTRERNCTGSARGGLCRTSGSLADVRFCGGRDLSKYLGQTGGGR